jgi:hypothetical protein
VAVIATGRRAAYLAGLAVAASALTVMLVARYVDLGQLGPLPDLYDPTWFPEKLTAAFAEGAATAAAITGAIITSRTLRDSRLRRGPKATTRKSQPEEYRDQEEHRNDSRIRSRRQAP